MRHVSELAMRVQGVAGVKKGRNKRLASANRSKSFGAQMEVS